MQKRLTSFGFIPLLFALAACGSSYTTQYNYIAPSTPQGLQCVSACFQNQQSCNQECVSLRSECEQMSQVKSGINAYGALQYSQGNTSDYPSYALLSNMLPDNCQNAAHCPDRCSAEYRDCFTVCGGQVTPYQVCTTNCH